MLPNLSEWLDLGPEARGDLLDALGEAIGDPWESDGRALWHPEVDTGFVFVPGGVFRPGLSPHEEQVLERWLANARAAERGEVYELPVPSSAEMIAYDLKCLRSQAPWREQVSVAPFLLAQDPVHAGHDVAAWSRARGIRVATDCEWEWAARAGTTTLTWRGDDPPSDRAMHRFDTHEDPEPNPLGLRGLGWQMERCVGDRSSTDGIETYRGGGQDCAPWQGTGEFVFVLSAWRAPRSDSSYSGAVRPAFSLPGP